MAKTSFFSASIALDAFDIAQEYCFQKELLGSKDVSLPNKLGNECKSVKIMLNSLVSL